MLAAAATGRWEAIQEVFNRPGQKSVVLGCRNKVIWKINLCHPLLNHYANVL